MNNPDSFEHLGQVAVVGMAVRFPGARDHAELWRNLRGGVESVAFFSEEELASEGVPAELLRNPKYVRANAPLQDVEMFDAAFFGINPKEARLTDPQHRLLLECAWTALEDAGYDSERYDGRVGVYASESFNTYFLFHLFPNRELLKSVGMVQTALGNDRDFLATRLSFNLNLRGPSVVVQSACSSSLVATHLACQSLVYGECDMALAGGVSISLPQRSGYFHQEGGINSPDGHCRPFDARAAGTVGGNGVGLVVLKRLEDAVAAGDHVYAVIKGSAINNDGSVKVGYTAPSIEGQARVIAEALGVARVDPSTVSYVEAHGTATPLGDPVELAALAQAFRGATDEKGYCAVGSVKSNFGHLDAAAGVAGLVKTVLALKHKELPPSLHFERPNPQIDFENSPFYVNAELKPWAGAAGAPRRAGVSSFGIGGTNAHVVLEEAPTRTSGAAARPWQLLVLSARTRAALERATDNLVAALREDAEVNLADVAYTLQMGRRGFAHRRMLVCRDVGDAVAALEARDPQRVFDGHAEDSRGVAFMFPGQGAQYVNMGRELYNVEPEFRAALDKCAELLRPHLGLDVREVLYADGERVEEAAERLNETRLTQPALFAVEYALARMWQSWGIEPEALIGHSLGEYVAACVSGVLPLEDALRLVAARGRLMQDAPPGAMLSVALGEAEVRPLLGASLSLAAVNSARQCVVAGDGERVEELRRQLAERGVACRVLQTRHGFHSSLMEGVLAEFAAAVRGTSFGDPTIPYVSNVTGQWASATEAQTADYWARQLRGTVRFDAGLRTLTEDDGRVLLEVGPGQTLSNLARRLEPGANAHTALPTLKTERDSAGDAAFLLTTAGRLWLAGVRLDWQRMHEGERRLRLPLPTYPFERERFWVDAPQESLPPVAVVEHDGAGQNGAGPGGDAAHALPQTTGGVAALLAETHAQAAAVTVTVTMGRRADVWARLRGIVKELTGHDAAEIDAGATFFELGVDSLLLIQASQLVEQEFGVELSFRQLLEEYPTLDALAAHLEAQMPAEEPAIVQAAAPVGGVPLAAEANSGAASTLPPVVHDAGGEQLVSLTDLERMTARLFASVQEELANLRRGGTPAAPTAANGAHPATGANGHVASGNGTNGNGPTAGANGHAAKIESAPYVPFKPIQGRTQDELTPPQRQYVTELVERYVRRTGRSRELIQATRACHADSRLAVGFRQLWKELIYPIVGESARGANIWDVDGNEYVDVTMGFGVHMFGHAPQFINEALTEQLSRGASVGPQSRRAGEAAGLLCELTGVERVAFCNSGTEANMSALRLARAATGRTKIAMFVGSYHGSFDGTLARPMAGRTGAVPLSPGVPASMIEDVLVLDYDTPEALSVLRERGRELAAVIVEPVQSRRPELQPATFLAELRRVTEQSGTVLIFDEVITGLRLHPGGAQAWFGVRADLTTYGKVLGGGLPVGAVGGRAALLDAVDGGMWQYGDASYPAAQQAYFAGTFFKHPLVMTAAHAVLAHLREGGPAIQERLNRRTAEFAARLNEFFVARELPVRVVHFGSLFRFAFGPGVKWPDFFFFRLVEQGVYVWEGRNCFLSTAHTDADLERVRRAVEDVAAEMQSVGFFPSPGGDGDVNGKASARKAVEPSGVTHAREAVTASPAPVLADEQSRLPLTEGQEQIWLACQMSEQASVAYNESLTLRLRGPFNADAMRRAVETVVERHEGLRVTFSPEGDYQRVAPRGSVEVEFKDLSSATADERQAQADAWIAERVRRPFDLARGPLLWAGVCKLEAEHHLFLVAMHHIVMDGWSSGILLQELRELYDAECRGVEPRLPRPQSYSEYARLLAARAEGEEAERDEAYWLNLFADDVPTLELPADRPRPAAPTYNGNRLRHDLPDAVGAELRSFCARHSCTSFVAMLAAFDVLAYHLTGAESFIVGLHSAGQLSHGAKHLLGYWLNLLPFRARAAGSDTFAGHLAQLKGALIETYAHQHYPLGRLAKQLNARREGSRRPLVAVTFNVDRVGPQPGLYGLEVEAAANPNGYSKFDLSINVVEGPEELYFECDYNNDLFDDATVRSWAGGYEVILRAAAERPERTLAELGALAGAAEREQQAARQAEFKAARRERLKNIKHRAAV